MEIALILLWSIISVFWVAVLMSSVTAVYLSPRYPTTAALLAIYALIVAGFTIQYMRLTTAVLPFPRLTTSADLRLTFLLLAITTAVYPLVALYATNENQQRLTAEAEAKDRRIIELTELAAARAEINQLRDNYVTMVTHELKTPLSTIVGYTGMLQQMEAPEAIRPYLEGIYRGTARLRVMADFNDALLKRLDIRPFNLNTMIAGFIKTKIDELWAGTRHQAGDVVILNTTAAIIVEADPEKLETAVMELIRNAIKVSKRGDVVTIGTAQLNGSFTVTVKDTGPGVAKADQARIFDRGVQLYADINNRPHEGSGFGLFVVSQVARMHGGRVTMINKLDKGARFSLTLPRRHT